MQIQISTDSNIVGREKTLEHVTDVVEHALKRFGERVTRVEVHLSDENGSKEGRNDKRCLMEVRLAGHQPTVVTHHADSLHEAVHGAIGKLERSVQSVLEQQDSHHGRGP